MKPFGTMTKKHYSQKNDTNLGNGWVWCIELDKLYCYYIPPSSGKPIICSTIQSLPKDELDSDVVQQEIRDLHQQIMNATSRRETIEQAIPQELQDEDYEGYEPMEPEADCPEADAFTPEMYDTLIAAEVLLPKGDILVPAKVIGRKWDPSGNPIGVANTNPILDTRVYDMQFPGSHTDKVWKT